MREASSLAEAQREGAVALLDTGWGPKAVATRLGVRARAIRRLCDRWRVRGGTALVTRPTKALFSLEFKLNAVQRFQAGESKAALAKELQLSSPQLIETWARHYRTEG